MMTDSNRGKTPGIDEKMRPAKSSLSGVYAGFRQGTLLSLQPHFQPCAAQQ